MKLRDIADRLGCRLEGDADVEITGVASLQQAVGGELTFVANARYLSQLASTKASAVILGRTKGEQPALPCAVLWTDDPYTAFAGAVELFSRATRPLPGIDPSSRIASGATVGAGVSIGALVAIGPGASVGARTIIYPHVVVGPDARIGDDCVIHSNVSIRERVVVGNRVVLQDGVVLGSDGYGFARQKDGTHRKIPQHADVVIEDDVEIGANSTVDRPAIGETRIRAGTKIDNLVHIAHGVSVGKRVLIAGQSGVAGSTTIGDDVMVAGQSGIAGHVDVGAGVKIGAKSAVLQSVDAGAFVTGSPAFDHVEWKKASVIFKALPSLKKKIDELEAKIAELEEKLR